jgi:hypothetical protein
MPGLIQTTKNPVVQDLSDYIVNIQRADTPLFTAIPKDTAKQTRFETQVDDYGDTDNIDGVGSSEDAANFQNMAENRDTIDNFMMKMWEKPMVDDFSENVDENPALTEGEYVDAVKKATVRLKFRMEKLLLSQAEALRQAGGDKYRTCSIGGFIKSSAPSGAQDVPAIVRPASGQIYTSTLAALTEENVHDIMQEIFEATYGQGKFTGFVGSELKQKISLMSIYRADVASHTVVRRINNQNNATLEAVVDVIVGDFGTITLVPTTRMRYFDGSAAATSATLRRGSGIILDLSKWGLAFKRKPRHKPMEDAGGGPRGIVDTIFGLRAKCPKSNGAINISS